MPTTAAELTAAHIGRTITATQHHHPNHGGTTTHRGVLTRIEHTTELTWLVLANRSRPFEPDTPIEVIA